MSSWRISGGIDSSVVAALSARALGPDRVLGLLMPERDSSADALRLGRLVAEQLGIAHRVEEIDGVLAALGCYERQAEAARMVFPEYGDGWRCKLVLPSLLDGDRLNVPHLVVADPSGAERRARMPPAAFLQLVAATNFKQRTRMSMAYYHADRLNYAVAGTPNYVEYDQGFFVKQGDGAADVKPIAHLYKTQVFALAEYLDVPAEIRAPDADDRHVLARPDAGGVLLRPAVRGDGPLPVGGRPRCAGGGGRPGRSAWRRSRSRPVFRDIAAKRRVARYLHHVPSPYERS